MPERMRGSVRARLRVRFSVVRVCWKASGVRASGSRPPGSRSASAASPRTRWREARRLVPASVRVRVPLGKSKAARLLRPPRVGRGLLSSGRQWRRPAIIRCRTRNKGSGPRVQGSEGVEAKAKTMRLPMRRRARIGLAFDGGDGWDGGAEEERARRCGGVRGAG